MTRLHQRLLRLEQSRGITPDDPRLTWAPQYGDPGRPVMLELADYCIMWAAEFAACGGPAMTPGFAALSTHAQTLLRDAGALWGTSRRFVRLAQTLVDVERETVTPLWWIEGLIARTQMRRRFPRLLAHFAERGDPLYMSHRTYRAENWPERATWTRTERDYISRRFFHWDQSPHDRERAWRGDMGLMIRYSDEQLSAGRLARRRGDPPPAAQAYRIGVPPERVSA